MWKNGEAIAPMHISGSSAYGLTHADVQINAERSIYFTFILFHVRRADGLTGSNCSLHFSPFAAIEAYECSNG